MDADENFIWCLDGSNRQRDDLSHVPLKLVLAYRFFVFMTCETILAACQTSYCSFWRGVVACCGKHHNFHTILMRCFTTWRIEMIEELKSWLVVDVLPGLPSKLAILAILGFFGYQCLMVVPRTAAEDYRLSIAHSQNQ